MSNLMHSADKNFTDFDKYHLDPDKSLISEEDAIFRKNEKILSICEYEM